MHVKHSVRGGKVHLQDVDETWYHGGLTQEMYSG